MTFIHYLGMALALVYGMLTVFGGIMQIKLKEVPLFSTLGFVITGGVVACTPYLIFQSFYNVYLLTFCLFLIHVLALFNGYYLFRKWNIQHHIFRLILSVIIILLLLDYEPLLY